MAWYFLGYFSRISDGHPYPFYPEVPPPPRASGPRGDKLIMKVSDIFHLQYLKTEIKLEKHNSVKKTVSVCITTCH